MSGSAADTRRPDPQQQGSLPRAARLVRPSEFKRVFENPTVSKDHCFRVLARAGSADRSRLGMAVSRRVEKRATARNRIKRIIRESFRQRFGAGGRPIDVVVLPANASATISNEQLFRSLDRHWTRILAKLDDNRG